jgi:hypothetical protein
MKRFLLFCSGADASALERCPTAASRYAGIGAAVLLAAILAGLSGGYALFLVLRSVSAAAALGVLWCVAILNLDRLIAGVRPQKSVALDLLYAVPHLAFSVLLALVISRPLQLKLFEAEIEQRWMRTGQGRAGAAAVQGGERVDAPLRENARLTGEEDARRRGHGTAGDALAREKEGMSGTGSPGPGPVFAAKERALLEAERELQRSARMGAGGLVARLEGLRALERESETVHQASLLVTLLLAVMFTAPLVLKIAILSPPRPYEPPLDRSEAG